MRSEIPSESGKRNKMDYKYTKKVNLPFDRAEAQMRENLMEQGFGILTEVDLKATLKEKLDVDYKRHTILGACNPNLAYEALGRTADVSLLLPCNVIVVDNEDGTTTVAAAEAKQLLHIIEGAELDDIAEEANELIQKAIDAL